MIPYLTKKIQNLLVKYKVKFLISKGLFSLQKRNFTFIDLTENSHRVTNLNELNKNYNLNVTNLSDNAGSRKVRRRVGRGPGCSKGKTSARGHRYRRYPYRHFEGGQTNVFRRLPKHGFRTKKFRAEFSYINIHKILYLINKGRIDPSKPIGIKELFYSGGVSKVVDGIKLLSRGNELLKDYPPLNITLHSATDKALESIKSNGGSVTISHGTRLYNRYLLKPARFTKDLKEPYPSFKRVRRMLRLKDKGAL